MSRHKKASEKLDTNLSIEQKYDHAHWGTIKPDVWACATGLWNAGRVEQDAVDGKIPQKYLELVKFHHDNAWRLFIPQVMEAFAKKDGKFFREMAEAIEFGLCGQADPARAFIYARAGWLKNYDEPMPTQKEMRKILKDNRIIVSAKTVANIYRECGIHDAHAKAGRPRNGGN